eukprot:s1005_g38.t1
MQVEARLFGIYWSEEELVEQATKAKHPFSLEAAIPPQLLDTVRFCVEQSDCEVARVRAEFMSRWTGRAMELESDQRKLKAGMQASVANAVKGKRILLFEEMLKSTGFPDMVVVAELQHGAELTGDVPVTNMLPGKFEPALISEKEFCANAARIRAVAESDVRSSACDNIDAVVWQKTIEEVDKGWLMGPLSSKDVPVNKPLPRRFGLQQKKDKVRLIDDCSESGVNSCVTVSESPVLHTVDIDCAVLMFWFSTCQVAGINSLVSVRTFDLASAYRQVGLNEKGQEFAYLKVYDPAKQGAGFFRSLVLPFGAVRSVHSFLRLARALWWIGVVGCRLVWISFYDDFISFSKPILSGSTEKTISLLFKLLGWNFAEEGDTAEPFSDQCSALGVLFDLTLAAEGKALIRNTAARQTELCENLSKVIAEGKLQSKQAQRLRGRMQKRRFLGEQAADACESCPTLLKAEDLRGVLVLNGEVAPGAPASSGNGQTTSAMIEPADPGLHCTSKGAELELKDFWAKANTVASSYPKGLRQQIRLLGLSLVGALTQGENACNNHWACDKREPMNPLERACGNDWPVDGFTMVGLVRLKNVADILWQVISNKIPGDFAELGVWRGGTCIFAKSILNAMGEDDRAVHVFDAFDKIPQYNAKTKLLSVSEETVRANFEMYQALDSKVIFHKGLFKDTLPQFHVKNPAAKLAVLRVDGNFYDSYQDALYYMYGFVPVGGYVIFDDVMSTPRAMQAWNDFKQDHGLMEELTRIDRHSGYFQKTRDVVVDFTKMRPPSV